MRIQILILWFKGWKSHVVKRSNRVCLNVLSEVKELIKQTIRDAWRLPLKATNVLQKNWFTSYLSGRCLINVYCHLNLPNTTNSRTESAVFVFFSSFYFLFYSSSSYLYNRFARLFLCGTTPSVAVWFPVASQVKFPRSVVVLSAVNH